MTSSLVESASGKKPTGVDGKMQWIRSRKMNKEKKSPGRSEQNARRGNCYVTIEALWHLLGGKKSVWQPAYVKHEGDTHWFLAKKTFWWVAKNKKPVEGFWKNVMILDPTRKQFRKRPPYELGRACGFLTKNPSKRAKKLMNKMLWQGEKDEQESIRHCRKQLRIQ